MTIIGSASVQIRALDNFFQKDVEAAVKKIKDVTVKISAEFDDNGVKEKIDDIRRSAEANAISLRAEADTAVADRDLQHLRDSNDGKKVTLDAQAATTDASAQLAYVARSRKATIYPVINAEALVTAKAILESLSGLNTLRSLKDMLKGLATGFDEAALKGVLLSSAVMSLVDSVAWLSSAAFGAGEGIAQLVGFFAMAPTLIASVSTVLVANHLAWNNFGDAMSDNVKKSTKALALLPPNAREAAVEVKSLWNEIKKPIQGAFWDGMDKSLQETVRAMAPALQGGLTETAATLGKLTHSALDSFKEIAENKSIDTMFKNLNLGLEALGGGIKPIFDAFNKLGFVGSQYLPQFGKWMADLAVRFDNFITKASAGGDIVRWIENAKAAMDDLWRIGDGVVGIFQGLTRAFDKAGSGGLDSLATSLLNVEAIIKGPVFQTQFSQIFSGMLQGAHAIKEGIGDLGKTLGDMSKLLGAVFGLAGGVIKNLMEGVSLIIGTTGFQVGIINAFGSIRTAMDDLAPSFRNLGDILGDLFSIASGIFTSIPTVINTATTLIKGILDNLKGGFMDLTPVLMSFVDTLIRAFSGPLLTISKVIGDLVEGFTKLPGPIQTVLIALGLALILLPKLKDALDGFRKGIKDAAKDSGDAKAGFMWMQDAKGWASNASKEIGNSFKDLRDGFVDSKNWGKSAAADLKAAGAMAARDFGNGIKGALSAAGFVGGEIGQAIGKSFDQAADAVKRAVAAVTPLIKEFGSGLWEGIKSQLVSLDTVRDGFSRIGQTISSMVDTAKGNLTGLAAAAGIAMGAAKYHIQQAFSDAKDSISNFANLAKAYMGDFAGQVKDRAMEAGNSIRDAVKNMASEFNTSLNPMRNALGHLWDDFQEKSIYAEKRARDALESVASAGRTVGDGFKAVGEQIGQMGSYAAARIEPVTRAAKNAATGLANLGTSAMDGLRTAATFMHDTAIAAAQNLSNNFAPVGAAFDAAVSSAKEGAAHIREHLGNIRDAFANMGNSTQPFRDAIGGVAGAIGTSARSGLRLAASGLLDALGGGWGIAIAGATTAISMFGQAQADAQAKVDRLAGALDEQSGAFTDSAKKMLAGDLLDQGATWWDDLFRSGRRNMQELVNDTGISSKEINDKLSDPIGREAFISNWKQIRDAAGDGRDVSEELAKSVGVTTDELKGMSQTDLDQFVRQIEKAGTTAQKAEEKVKALADATGKNTVQAAILAQNYEVLGSKTSSVSDKFSALKSNLDILSNGQMSATKANKDYYTQLDATNKSLDDLKAKNGENIKTFFDMKDGFQMQIPAARDLHTALQTQADGILQLGISTMQTAMRNGDSIEASQAKAMASMEGPIASFRKSLEGMGFVPAQVDAIVGSFGLLKDQYTTAIKVDGVDKATMDIARVHLAGEAFAQGNYTAMLAALPDEAKKAIGDAYGVGKEFADGNYEAVLKALDHSPGGRDAALATISLFTGGDWNAYLKAVDITSPGVTAAGISIRNVTDKDYHALIEARYNGNNDSSIESALNWLSRNRTVSIGVVYNQQGDPLPSGTIARPGMPLGNNGGVVLPGKSPFDGPFPMGKLSSMVKMFANGGLENHVAQISRGQTPFRIWSEPETGGEAYIPLGMSKRKRSKEILELVARQFGFGLFQMFADGGFSQHVQGVESTSPAFTSSATTSTQAMPAPQIHVHPSAAMDERKVGELAARELWFQLQNK